MPKGTTKGPAGGGINPPPVDPIDVVREIFEHPLVTKVFWLFLVTFVALISVVAWIIISLHSDVRKLQELHQSSPPVSSSRSEDAQLRDALIKLCIDLGGSADLSTLQCQMGETARDLSTFPDGPTRQTSDPK